MSRRAKFWLAIGVLFLLGNFVGLWMALAAGELVHACLHGVLLFLTAIAIGRVLARRIATS